MGRDSLVPLVDSVIVYECRLDLYSTQEARVNRRAVVDIERDRREIRRDIAAWRSA